jgi:predicted PP-loop superfamily ATPase
MTKKYGSTRLNIVLAAIAFSFGVATAAPSEFREGQKSVKADKAPIFLAKKKRKSKGSREKHIVREGKTVGKDTRNIDFDAVDIGGQSKTPLGTLINQNKADKNYDFVKIRLRWHPEMVQSASSLDSGR